jgi:hypothetical protein
MSNEEVIRRLKEELKEERLRSLKIKMHMQVLCAHPVGLASKMIAKKYSRDCVTKEQQMALLN